MIRRPHLLLFLSVAILFQLACSRDAESPGTNAGNGTGTQTSPSTAPPQSAAGEGTTTAPPLNSEAQVRVDPTKFPDVVARVGKDSISRSDLLNAARQLVAQAAQTGTPPPPSSLAFFREVLDSLVVRQLLYLDATSQGIKASDADVNNRIAEIKARFPDAKKFDEALAAQGISQASLRDNARTILTVDRYIAEKFAPKVQVTEETIRAYYEQNPNEMKIAERRRLRHILIRPEGQDEAAKAKAKKLAEDVLDRIKKGEDFAALAAQYSADPGSKGNGGELPPMAQGETVPPFEKAAWALAKGETSGVVETQFGFHIIQMIDVLPAKQVPFDQVKGRIEQFLRNRDLKTAVRSHADGLRSKTPIEVMI